MLLIRTFSCQYSLSCAVGSTASAVQLAVQPQLCSWQYSLSCAVGSTASAVQLAVQPQLCSWQCSLSCAAGSTASAEQLAVQPQLSSWKYSLSCTVYLVVPKVPQPCGLTTAAIIDGVYTVCPEILAIIKFGDLRKIRL